MTLGQAWVKPRTCEVVEECATLLCPHALYTVLEISKILAKEYITDFFQLISIYVRKYIPRTKVKDAQIETIISGLQNAILYVTVISLLFTDNKSCNTNV